MSVDVILYHGMDEIDRKLLNSPSVLIETLEEWVRVFGLGNTHISLKNKQKNTSPPLFFKLEKLREVCEFKEEIFRMNFLEI